MSSLCPSCHAGYERWIDYRYTGPLGRWRTDAPGKDHVDLYWQRSLDNLRRAREDRMELSRWQCQLIKRICAGRHAAPIEGVTP